jgi:predicted transcriptional regulator
MMGRIVGVRLGAELQAKLDALCEGTRQRKSDVLRQALRVVNVEQLRQASQESRPEQAECGLSGALPAGVVS